MDSSKVKPGHWLAGIAGVLLLVSMLLDWYGGEVTIAGVTVKGGGGNAFDSPGFLGGLADLVIIACALVAIGYLVIALTDSKVELPMPGGQMAATAGAAAAVLIFLRMIFQPGPNEFIALKFGIYFAFVMAILVAIGGYLGMQEEGAGFDRGSGSVSGGGSPPGGAPPSSQAPPPPPAGGPQT